MEKLVNGLLPVMKIAAFIGVICGLLIAGMGVARMYGAIDLGPEFENIEPLWMIIGGLVFCVTMIYKLSVYKKRRQVIIDHNHAKR